MAAQAGPGGAKFGGGGGGANRYDYTQWGGGLYSIGIDPSKAGFQDQVTSWYNSQPANVKAEVDSYWKNNKKTGNAGFDLANAVDWRQRDVARKIQKEHGMFDFLGPLAPLGGALATAGGTLLGGPIGGALAGGLVGGVQGGPLGAVLGGAGGYFGGGLLNKIGIPTNMLGLPGGGTVSGLLGNVGSGLGAVSNVNQFMPADIAARASHLAPIVDKSVALPAFTPPGVFEASKDLLTASINPANIATGIAKNVAGDAISSFLMPEAQAASGGGGGGGGLLGGGSAGGAYTQSPYPELFRRARRGISNQLV